MTAATNLFQIPVIPVPVPNEHPERVQDIIALWNVAKTNGLEEKASTLMQKYPGARQMPERSLPLQQELRDLLNQPQATTLPIVEDPFDMAEVTSAETVSVPQPAPLQFTPPAQTQPVPVQPTPTPAAVPTPTPAPTIEQPPVPPEEEVDSTPVEEELEDAPTDHDPTDDGVEEDTEEAPEETETDTDDESDAPETESPEPEAPTATTTRLQRSKRVQATPPGRTAYLATV